MWAGLYVRSNASKRMSLSSLKAVLEATLTLLKPGQRHYPDLFEADGITPQQHFPSWLVEPIVDEINEADELRRLLTNNLNTLNSSGKISAWHIAQAAAHRLLTDTTADTVVSDLVDFAHADECICQTYVSICGDGITERIDLSSDVAVMPAVMAPKSFARQLIFGIDRWDRHSFQKGLPIFVPNIAILVSQTINPLTEEANIETRRLQYLEESVQKAIRALTLSSGCPFTRNWQVSRIDHPSIPYDGIGSYSATGILEEAPKPRIEASQPVDANLARRLYATLDALPSNVRTPVELVTDRLRRSRVHNPSVDTALDLGVAGEIILLHPSADSELSYRFALRGAYLIAIDRHDRKVKFEAFRAMYHARSRAAHRGTLDAKHQTRLAEFDWLCRTAICKIIERRAFPDWEDLVLGAAMQDFNDEGPAVSE